MRCFTDQAKSFLTVNVARRDQDIVCAEADAAVAQLAGGGDAFADQMTTEAKAARGRFHEEQAEFRLLRRFADQEDAAQIFVPRLAIQQRSVCGSWVSINSPAILATSASNLWLKPYSLA